MLLEFGFVVHVFVVSEVFLKSDMKRSTRLSNIFSVAWWAGKLVNSASIIFILNLITLCREESFYVVISDKFNFDVCVLEQICDKSCFFAHVCKHGLFSLLGVMFSFVIPVIDFVQDWCVIFIIVQNFFQSIVFFCMLVGSRLYVVILLTKYLIADSLCSRGDTSC
jgi:hypothetical protein